MLLTLLTQLANTLGHAAELPQCTDTHVQDAIVAGVDIVLKAAQPPSLLSCAESVFAGNVFIGSFAD